MLDQVSSLDATSAPLVSVVIPAYNHQDYVADAINSLLNQTLDNWEAIIIDDASPDATWQSINSFRDDRLTCYRHAINLGAHQTINEAIDMARGQFISILNSDDVYMPTRLERLVHLINEQGTDLATTDVSLITSHGVAITEPTHWWLKWHNALKARFAETNNLTATLFDGNMFVTTSNFFMRRKLVDEIGLFANFRYVHDYEFLFRLLANHRTISFAADEKLLSYRLHGANTILENRRAAAQETLDLILSWHPKLAEPFCEPVAAAASAHLRRVYSYIEQEHAAQLERELHTAEDELARITGNLSRAEHLVKTELSHARRTINEQAAEISSLRPQLHQLHATCAENETKLDTLRIQRDELAKALKERDDIVKQKEAAIGDLQSQYDQLTMKLNERDALIHRQHNDLLTLATKTRAVREQQQLALKQLDAVTRDRDALRHSRSFRLGNALLRPLSPVKRWLRQ